MRLWLKIDAQLARHRKTYRLADLLAERAPSGLFTDKNAPETEWRARAVALLLDFWAYVAEHHPDGDITTAHPWAIRDVMAFWIGSSEWGRTDDLRTLLLASGHVDKTSDGRLVVHDWADWAGSGIAQLAGDRRRNGNRRQVYAAGNFTGEDWTELVGLLRSRCAYCGAFRQRLSTDHVWPIARGGPHDVGNVVPACRHCNNRKNDRYPFEAGMEFDPDLWKVLSTSRFAVKATNLRPKSGNRQTKGKEASTNSVQEREEERREDKEETNQQQQLSPSPAVEPATALPYELRCVVVVNQVLDRQLAGAYRSLRAEVERPIAAAWEADGIPIALVEHVLAERASTFRATPHNRQPHTLRYFDAAVREAWAKRQATDAPPLQTDADRMRAAAAAERQRETLGASS